MNKFKGVIVAESEVEDEVIEFDSLLELNAFADGLSTGASLYGAGGCELYTLDNMDEIDDDEIFDRVKKLLNG